MSARLLSPLVCLVLLATSPAAQPLPSFRVEPLTLPAPLDSGEARLVVQGDRAFVSWFESAEDRATFKFAARTATGWSAPVSIVSGSNLIVNAADVPSMLALSNGSLIAQWMQAHGDDPEAYDLRLAHSADAGRTWSQAVSPHHDNTESQHGFASMFELSGGAVGLVWLDGRSGADMALRATTYGADWKQRDEIQVDPRVCECCQTAVAVTAEGPIVVFRDRSNEEVRDIAVSRLVAGRWTAPSLVHRDNWKIDGCPVNGPAVSAAGRAVAVAWFAMQGSQGHVFVAFSRDAGRTFSAPVRVDDVAAQGRVQVERLDDESVAVSWVDFSAGRSQFRVRRVTTAGARGPAVTIAEGIGTQYPRMTRRAGELLFAWSENTRGSTRVRTARSLIPNP